MQSLKSFLSSRTSFYKTVIPAGVLLVALCVFFPAQQRAKAYIVDPNRQELSSDPGTAVSGQFNVINTSDQSQTFYVSVENFEAADETGNPKFVPTQEGLAIWTTVPASVTAAAHATATIPFKIAVPKDADPGGYSAAIFAATQAPTTAQDNVSVGSRVGMLLLFDVNGNVTEGISILNFGTQGLHRFYSGLPIDFYYRFQNSGNDRIKPLGDVIIKNMLGQTTKILNANRVDGNVLPQSIRRFETPWIRDGGFVNEMPMDLPTNPPHLSFFGNAKEELTNFAFGVYTAHLNLAYGNTVQKSATATYTFFVIPWQLIIIVLVILILLYYILRFVMRGYNTRIIEQAKRRQ